LIDARTAVEEASRGLHSVLGDAAVRSLAQAHPGTPLLVARIDDPNGDYYLVPWENERGVAVIVQVNARSGAMASLAELPSPQPGIVITPDDAVRAVPNARGIPRLVWQPCRESSSAFLPFYRIDTGEGAVFVRGDGRVFQTLTPFGRGG
jgi:hypothetical protein